MVTALVYNITNQRLKIANRDHKKATKQGVDTVQLAFNS